MQTAMDIKDLILPLIAALWGCTTLVFSATAELNRLRDIVILGHDKGGTGETLSLKHRHHIMHNDWKPMVACMITACFGFSAVSAISPFLLERDLHPVPAWLITLAVTLYAAFMGVVWIPTARSDWRAMKAALEEPPPKAHRAHY